jgi:phosphoribosyl-ATP pyrophosphohydrolase
MAIESEQGPGYDVVERLYKDILASRAGRAPSSRTAKLMATGMGKIAQKVGEEAVEVVIEAVRECREGVVLESADLLYQLTVLWAHLGIEPTEIWAEMERRETMLGIAEKLPKHGTRLAAGTMPATEVM